MAVAPLVRRAGIDRGRGSRERPGPWPSRFDDGRSLVVVHDELDLPSGRVKVKVGGGKAGNNGLKSIDSHLHGNGYLRVRVGIGKPPGRQPGADYVLKRPGAAERAVLEVAVEAAADAVEAHPDRRARGGHEPVEHHCDRVEVPGCRRGTTGRSRFRCE